MTIFKLNVLKWKLNKLNECNFLFYFYFYFYFFCFIYNLVGAIYPFIYTPNTIDMMSM